jgi:hypothetical protein
MKISFFKINKPKPFEYKPLYYDPKKDNENKEKSSDSVENKYKSELKSKIEDNWAIGKRRTRQSRGFINQRNLIIYIAIALMLLYFVLK